MDYVSDESILRGKLDVFAINQMVDDYTTCYHFDYPVTNKLFRRNEFDFDIHPKLPEMVFQRQPVNSDMVVLEFLDLGAQAPTSFHQAAVREKGETLFLYFVKVRINNES